jgi:Asp-tRNA(Asn)/Glu-tRNA(Gln) amidotransferase A subunit family amidase
MPSGESRAEHEARVMDRLRTNLRAAGIPASEEDLERIEADGYVERVAEAREILAAAEMSGLPDFLAGWGPPPGAAPYGGTGAEGVAEAGRRTREGSAHAPEPGDDDGIPHRLADVAELLRRGEISPVELAERALERVSTHDAELNLFQLVLADRAMDAARRAEEEIRRGDHRGPLHGVPVAVKDLFQMRDTVTTAGSIIHVEGSTDTDAAAVERLQEAGAVIVGKTRLSEFAYWPGSTNPHYGSTRNPVDPEHDAGGSSSGSAAAVATGCVYAALGTDTGGSVRIPAALCGVVGHKPTFGRASLAGCVPLAWSLDHVGPLTRSVEDASLVLEVLAGHDPQDARTRAGSDYRTPDAIRRAASAGGADLAGVRVGVMAADGSGQELGSGEALAAWHASNERLRERGATLVDVDLSDMHVLWRVASLTLAVEAAAYHARSLRRHYDRYGRFCRGRLVGAFAYGFDDMLRAQRVRARLRERWSRLWDRCDVLSTPSQPDVAPLLGVAASTRYTNPFNALGWPAVSVPYGAGKGGLPLGTQIAGKPWDDGTVLRVAAALEH